MSTFDGVVREFPQIRGNSPTLPFKKGSMGHQLTDLLAVDFFRGVIDDPPLASFLSHTHSDHLAGLDTYKGRPYEDPPPPKTPYCT